MTPRRSRSDQPGANEPGPDEPGPDEVVYELHDWDEVRRDTLEELLAGEGVAYRWEPVLDRGSRTVPGQPDPPSPSLRSGLLVVTEADAELVEELIDELDHPDALAVDDDCDDGGAGVLSALYVAADVLCGTPRSAQAAGELLEAARATREAPVPYGLDPGLWSELARLTEDLARGLREGAEEDEVVELANRLRRAVHPLV